MRRIALWFRAARAPFLQASVIPVIVGSALAVHDGAFSWGLGGVMVAAICAINIGTNLANDYYDHVSGADERNPSPTRFSGGSRVIQEGLVPPEKMRAAAMRAYAVGVGLGLYLVFRSGPGLLLFGIVGVTLSFFYTAPPLKLGYRGWGEPLVGILLGPMAVQGAYYVYTGVLSLPALVLSLPIGLLVMAILYVNEFPDADSDAASGKFHWVVRIGRRRAVYGYFLILATAYVSIAVGAGYGIIPAWTLLAILGVPLSVRAARALYRDYERPQKLVPAMGLTVRTHLSVGLLLAAGLIVDAWKVT